MTSDFTILIGFRWKMEEQAALIQSRVSLGSSVDDGTWGIKLEEHPTASQPEKRTAGPERAFIEELGLALFRSGCPTDIIEDRECGKAP